MLLSPEWQLLLACAKTHLTGSDLAQIGRDLIHASIDWDRLTERACYHGVAPLLYNNLRYMDTPDVWSRDALGGLKRAYYATAARNALLYQALHQMLHALDTTSIPLIVLKGAALAETVYPHRALRPMSDVDLLIHKADLPRVEDILMKLGNMLQAHTQSKAWYQEHHYHVVFINPERSAITPPIEVHWHIDRPSNAFRIDIDGLWERAIPVPIAGVETLMLAPEDLLLHLCLHTCRHAGSPMAGGMLNFRLRSFCDLADTIRQYGPSLNWGDLIRRASQWCIQPYVYLTLQLAKELLDAAMPESILEELKPTGFDMRLLRWTREELLQEPDAWPIFPQLLTLWKGRSFKDRAAVVANILSRDVIAKAYAIPPASKKVYFYYPRRLKDLLTRYGPVLWRLCRHDQHVRALADQKSQLAQWLAWGWQEPR
jgi:hypothetical protein